MFSSLNVPILTAGSLFTSSQNINATVLFMIQIQLLHLQLHDRPPPGQSLRFVFLLYYVFNDFGGASFISAAFENNLCGAHSGAALFKKLFSNAALNRGRRSNE